MNKKKKDNREFKWDDGLNEAKFDLDELTKAMTEVNQNYGTITTSGTAGSTIPTHQHTLAPQYNWHTAAPIAPPTNWGMPAYHHINMGECPELELLVKMLKVEPGGSEGILLNIGDKYYSLVNILKAQVELMMRMNILLVHRNLGDEADD